jgi:hypothetical protein
VHTIPAYTVTAHCHRVVHADEQRHAIEVLPLDHGPVLVGSCLRMKISPSYTLARCRLPAPGMGDASMAPDASIPGITPRPKAPGSWPPSAGRWCHMTAGRLSVVAQQQLHLDNKRRFAATELAVEVESVQCK